MLEKQKMISVRELLRLTAIKYQKIFKKFFWIYLFSISGSIIFIIFLTLYFVVDQFFLPSKLWLSILSGFLMTGASILAIIVSLLGTIALFLLMQDVDSNFRDLIKKAKFYFWPFAWANFLVGLFVLLWSLLLFVPGVIYYVFYSLTSYVLIFEGIKGQAALKRSKELIQGYWWPVFWRIIIFQTLLLVAQIVISAPLAFFNSETIVYSVVSLVVSFLASIILIPATFVYPYLIYQNLKAINPTLSVASVGLVEK